MSLMTETSLNGLSTHGQSMGRTDPSSSGFTAVNGDRQSSASFRPDDSGKGSAEGHKEGAPDNVSSPVQYHSHGWRADERTSYTHQHEPRESKKRKRSGSAGAEPERDARSNQQYDNATEPPNRRTTNLDSAIDVSSPANATPAPYALPSERRAPEPAPARSYSRERSPIRRWNRGEPPPQPRPEIEAGLAESLQRELQNHQQTQARTQAHPDTHRSSSPADTYTHEQQQQSYSPDPLDMDPKKRKRNFSNRTKTGCHTCRSRKKKCDERKPTCNNCERGGFQCEGYGPKPPGGFKTPGASSRVPVTLQSKPPYEPAHGPTGYYHSPIDEPPTGRSYSHWGRVPSEAETQHPATIDPRHPSYHGDGWPKTTAWPPSEAPALYMPPPPEYPIPPMHTYAPGHPLPPTLEPWAIDRASHSHMRPPAATSTAMTSRESGSTTSSQRTAALALAHNYGASLSEKDRMLLGRPFHHFIDSTLLKDRKECQAALERYNESARTTSYVGPEVRARFFREVIDPAARERRERDESYTGPQGYIGTSTVVDSPFNCDYGYNINLGNDVVIQSGCYMQDACAIRVGNRTLIGPNVKFYGITASVDSTARKGSQGTVQGGAIHIGDDCFIGGDVIILPFRKIGNGAVVGAGSVVTKDVKENTVVAGNPAKVIRRIEPGPNIDRHHPDIQEQNERMLREMFESAKRGPDR